MNAIVLRDHEVILVTDALRWTSMALMARDEMLEAVQCTTMRFSPVTERIDGAIKLLRTKTRKEET